MTTSLPKSLTHAGVVSEVYPKMCNVLFDDETANGVDKPSVKKRLCTYRRAQVFDREAEWRERSPVAPGDRVMVTILGSKDGVIEEILPRKNCIQRRAPGREGKVLHTLAANLDFMVIVASLREPDFSPGLIDRFLIAAIEAEIAPALVINKMDLAKDQSEKPWQVYEDFGVRCYPISTQNSSGIEVVQNLIRGKTSVFCGHSGVGKTSLLQNLFGEAFGKIGKVNTSTGKGKHTTTVSTLIEGPDQSRFIDTPGIKEFGLYKIDPKILIQYFPELYQASQKGLPIEDLPRYESYLRIKTALQEEGR